MWDVLWDIVSDAALDSLKIFPFILLIYVLMELIENAANKEKIERVLSGPFAPAVASALGAVPECGFAVMCAKLFDKGLIRVGTLIAAFVSISDEGVIILLSDGRIADTLIIMGVKIVYAIIVGEAINFALRGVKNKHICPDKDDCIECGERHEKKIDKYFLHPLKHAVKIFAYVFVINIVLGAVIRLVGEDNIASFINRSYGVQPFFTALIGLIPNCGSSVILSQAFIKGVIGFSGLIAGLSANAGIGILILLRSKKNFTGALKIMGAQYVLAVILGFAVMGVSAL